MTDLDLDALPMGKISRLWVVMAEDGLSEPIKVPVIVAKVSDTEDDVRLETENAEIR